MRPILIGAGRGSRLAHLTTEMPKTLVPVMGRPMLDWILDALAAAGFSKKDVVFVCGYRADALRARYPEFTYVVNDAGRSDLRARRSEREREVLAPREQRLEVVA